MYLKNPEYFLTIVKERSISRAAEKLYLSQPYLSQYLAKLESNLGVTLLDRSRSPLQLTQAGALFQAYLERQSFLNRQLENDLRDLQDRKRPELHIGVSPWRGSVVLPDIMPRFSELYPDVHLVLHECPVPQLPALAQDGITDFCLGPTPIDLGELTYEQVIHERVLLCIHRDNPLVKGVDSPFTAPKHFDLSRLGQERVIMLPADWWVSKLLYNAFSSHNMEPKDILITTNNNTAINLTAEKMGVSFLFESGILRTPYMDKLSFFTVGEPPITANLMAAYKKNAFLSPAARAFIDLVKEKYRSFDRMTL